VAWFARQTDDDDLASLLSGSDTAVSDMGLQNRSATVFTYVSLRWYSIVIVNLTSRTIILHGPLLL